MVEPGNNGSERLLTLRLNTTAGPVTLVSVYAPTISATPDTKDEFYDQLSATISNISNKEQLILLGDFNARVGADQRSWPSCLGKFGIGKMNDNGQRLLELALTTTFALPTPFSRPNLSTRSPGDTRAQSTGISWIVSWSDELPLRTFSTHVLTTARTVTQTIPRCVARSGSIRQGSTVARSKGTLALMSPR